MFCTGVRRISRIVKGDIPVEIRQSFKAAGILPFATCGSDGYILLGLQKHKHKYFWSAFGGKIIENEQIEETAIREFKEECNLYANKQYDDWLQLINQPNSRGPCIWNEPSKFLYFPLIVPFNEEKLLNQVPDFTQEKILLKWFRINEIFNYVDKMKGKKINEVEKIKDDNSVGKLILSPFFLATFRIANTAETINEYLQTVKNDQIKIIS